MIIYRNIGNDLRYRVRCRYHSRDLNSYRWKLARMTQEARNQLEIMLKRTHLVPNRIWYQAKMDRIKWNLCKVFLKTSTVSYVRRIQTLKGPQTSKSTTTKVSLTNSAWNNLQSQTINLPIMTISLTIIIASFKFLAVYHPIWMATRKRLVLEALNKYRRSHIRRRVFMIKRAWIIMELKYLRFHNQATTQIWIP